jgi:hypothetical protein
MNLNAMPGLCIFPGYKVGGILVLGVCDMQNGTRKGPYSFARICKSDQRGMGLNKASACRVD